MTAIPGWAWIGIGLAVSIASLLLILKVGSENMKIFFVLGILLIIWGVGKMIIGAILNKDNKPKHKSPPHPHQQHQEQANQQKQHQQAHQQHVQNQHVQQQNKQQHQAHQSQHHPQHNQAHTAQPPAHPQHHTQHQSSHQTQHNQAHHNHTTTQHGGGAVHAQPKRYLNSVEAAIAAQAERETKNPMLVCRGCQRSTGIGTGRCVHCGRPFK
ncbi:MAG: hypothetical protein KKG59_05610 [Nanoarchaeota archaeon]|nr:hypothetical protein [Nanoarchaeota archaeon]